MPDSDILMLNNPSIALVKQHNKKLYLSSLKTTLIGHIRLIVWHTADY